MAQQFSGLPMEDLIGGPLNAAAKANAAMALTQTKFMLETCFNVEKKDDGSTATYKPIMIAMALERGVISYEEKDIEGKKKGDPKIDTVTTSFNLPMLTVIPLNSLAVSTVDIGFEMEVKSSFSETEHQEHSTETKGEVSVEAKLGWGPLSVTVKGSASYDSKDSSTHDTHYEKSNSAKYTVSVHAAQLPVPKGVNTIIEAFTQAIQPIQMPTTAPAK
ncbi:MAG: DUF2589 domain-containing protein [Prevotellaceae bacterium]|nr:DUF2589 domain-containing protein [Prevotellaceae bacterium]